MTTDRRFDSFKEAAPVIRCHEENITALQQQVRHLEKIVDTMSSPWWKRLLFRLDGWPSGWIVASAPAWRPWRRWYRS